jgi:hypothetical protein
MEGRWSSAGFSASSPDSRRIQQLLKPLEVKMIFGLLVSPNPARFTSLPVVILQGPHSFPVKNGRAFLMARWCRNPNGCLERRWEREGWVAAAADQTKKRMAAAR